MRRFLVAVAFLVAILPSCDNKRKNREGNQPSLPEAMQEPKTTSFVSKRYQEDPVNTIYTNLLDKSTELKDLDKRISGLGDERTDSTYMVMEYIKRNNQYYNSAERHLESIKDSVLKADILRVMSESKKRLDATIGSHKAILSSVELSIEHINSQREALKILLSLPVIEEYQRLNMPSIRPTTGFDSELKKLELKLDSIIRKNGG